MILESHNDQTEIENVLRIMTADMREMQKAIASFRKHRAMLQKVVKAIGEGRITPEHGANMLKSIKATMAESLDIIQERGLGLGQGDMGDYSSVSKTLTHHLAMKALA